IPSTPASSASFACWPRRAKSALRIEGSIETRGFMQPGPWTGKESESLEPDQDHRDTLGQAGRRSCVRHLAGSLCPCVLYLRTSYTYLLDTTPVPAAAKSLTPSLSASTSCRNGP